MRKPNLFDHLWNFPQHLAAVFLFLLFCLVRRVEAIEYHPGGIRVLRISSMAGGVSLGYYVFVGSLALKPTIQHEIGHSKQARLLGPLYLLIVGLPSFLFALVAAIQGPAARRWYYRMFTEAWADKLGGVARVTS